ncbi:MAG: sigma-70 family RNA polymerase sigma factor [Planctomycetes bacterium]|nr:sigma-70 family RNA polymerase sigma factor [Planctomycetota bacterium]
MDSDLGPPTAAPSLAQRLPAELDALAPYARRLAASASFPVDPEDLVQDVAERALRYAHAFDPAQPLGPWLRRTALRVLLDRRARRRREPQRLADDDEPLARTHDGTAEREHVRRLLAPLSAIERAALIGFHAEGRTVAELAARLALPAGTVKSHLHRARRKLAARRDGGPSDAG